MEELRQQKRAALDRLLALQEDFGYNLELLDGRDAELAQYERQLESLQAELQRCHHESHSLSTQLQLVVTRTPPPIRRAVIPSTMHCCRPGASKARLAGFLEPSHSCCAGYEEEGRQTNGFCQQQAAELEALRAQLHCEQQEAALQLQQLHARLKQEMHNLQVCSPLDSI